MPEPTVPAPVIDGQGDVAPASGQASQEPFYKYKYADGSEDKFSTPEELTKSWRDSYLRQQDYTRKSQAVAKEREQFTKEQDDFKAQMKAFQEMRAKYDRWDQALSARPGLLRDLETRISGPASPKDVYERATGYADEKEKALGERIEKLEKMLAQQGDERELDSVFGSMEKKYGDFDRAATRELLEQLADGKTEPLVEMLYHAHKGRQDPVAVQQRLAENAAKKKEASLTPSGGAVPPKSGDVGEGMDIADARMQALADEGVL